MDPPPSFLDGTVHAPSDRDPRRTNATTHLRQPRGCLHPLTIDLKTPRVREESGAADHRWDQKERSGTRGDPSTYSVRSSCESVE